MKKRSEPHGSGVGLVRYELDINRWGGIHTALSIAVTVLIGIHGALLFPGASGVGLAIWLGVLGFIVLVVLVLSGLLRVEEEISRIRVAQKVACRFVFDRSCFFDHPH